MTELQDEDAGVSIEDAAAIGFKVIEMADRVSTAHACCPGSNASWTFTMDDRRFAVVVTVAPDEAPASTGRAA